MVAASWLQLRVLGESNIVKTTILFPIIGWFLAYDERIANYLFSKGVYESIGEAYAAPTSFYFMYFGLLLIGIASIIYQIFCPALAKENRSENEYIEKFMLHKNSGRLESFLFGIQLFGKIDQPKDVLSIEVVKTFGVDDQADRCLAHLLDRHFTMMNSSKNVARFACTCLYGVGATLLFVPTMITSFRIVGGLLRAI